MPVQSDDTDRLGYEDKGEYTQGVTLGALQEHIGGSFARLLYPARLTGTEPFAFPNRPFHSSYQMGDRSTP